jgi:hypothetical protein
MYPRIKNGGNEKHPHQYLQIVESYRTGKEVRQRVICNLGRLDQLQDSGELDRLIDGLLKYSRLNGILNASREDSVKSCFTKQWGAPLVFGRLWEQQGLPEIIGKLSDGRKHQFNMERVCFALALQRLCNPGSDLQGSEWVRKIEAEGFESIELRHMYRTVGWLSEVRDDLERELFFRDRDLFNQELDLVFIDTTSTYIYRDEETEFAKRGYSRDKRPDLPQMVLCAAVDRGGWPIGWEVFPGNTADVRAFESTIQKLRERFRIGRVSVVADRGMISRSTIKFLEEDEEAPFDYILGCRLRKDKEVSEEVLSRAGRYREVSPNLKVKEVCVGARRYVICRNDDEATKDAAARDAIVAKLDEKLASGGGKSLVKNIGYRRFIKGSRGAWVIDKDAVETDAKFDGVFVLRTNMSLPADEIAKTYKGLWRVERTFREQKSTLEMRPLFHHCDDNRIGHIAASFLALRLEVDLLARLEKKGVDRSWPSLMNDLACFQSVTLALDGVTYRIRTDFEGNAYEAFKAAGVRPPPRISTLSYS